MSLEGQYFSIVTKSLQTILPKPNCSFLVMIQEGKITSEWMRKYIPKLMLYLLYIKFNIKNNVF